jgi:hypothetical protein
VLLYCCVCTRTVSHYTADQVTSAGTAASAAKADILLADDSDIDMTGGSSVSFLKSFEQQVSMSDASTRSAAQQRSAVSKPQGSVTLNV